MLSRLLPLVVLPALAPGSWIAIEEAKLFASDPGTLDQFGAAVAVSGDTAVVGSTGAENPSGIGTGAAYVFVRSGSTWIEQAKLTPSDGEASDNFGVSVDVDGDTVVVGADEEGQPGAFASGSAYVFVRSGSIWTEQQKLTASDGAQMDHFGGSVAVSGETVIAGATGDEHAGSLSGSAYVFSRSVSTWTEQQKLTAGDADAFDSFGQSCALLGDTAVVGARGDDEAGSNAGAVYVFERAGTTWSETQKLTASNAAADDQLGGSVAIAGQTILAGARLVDHGSATDAGSAYVFRKSGALWSEEQELVASDPSLADQFAISLALDGDTAVIGSANNEPGETPLDVGSAYLFTRSGASWSEVLLIVPSDPELSAYFGYAVAVEGTTVVVGAFGVDHPTISHPGAAYAFELCPPPVSYCTAGTSASGCQATLSAGGTPSATASSGFDLLASGVEGAKDGLFFFGTNGRQANPWGNGTSLQCVVPPVTRASLKTGNGTTGACDGTFAQDLNALWCASCPKPSKNPGVGATVQAQLWYRDPQSTSNQTTSLSDALEFCVGP